MARNKEPSAMIFNEDEVDDLSKLLQRQAVFEYARDLVVKSRIFDYQTCPCCDDGRIKTQGIYEIIAGIEEMRFISIKEAIDQLNGVLNAHLDGPYLRLFFKDRQVKWMLRSIYVGNKWEQDSEGNFIPPKWWRDENALPGEFVDQDD